MSKSYESINEPVSDTTSSILQVRLVVELLWPLFLFFILVWVRSTNKPINKGQCKYLRTCSGHLHESTEDRFLPICMQMTKNIALSPGSSEPLYLFQALFFVHHCIISQNSSSECFIICFSYNLQFDTNVAMSQCPSTMTYPANLILFGLVRIQVEKYPFYHC